MLAKALSGCVRALEVGCGTGLFSRLVADLLPSTELVCTELAEQLLAIAARESSRPNIRYQLADVHHLPFANGTFDAVWGSSVLHHLDLTGALMEMRRVLSIGGKIVFAEPNILNPQIWAEREIGFLRRRLGVSLDETAFNRFSLKRKLGESGFVDITLTPHEFLHPAVPENLIPAFERLTAVLESIPFVREIGGSLLIVARKR